MGWGTLQASASKRAGCMADILHALSPEKDPDGDGFAYLGETSRIRSAFKLYVRCAKNVSQDTQPIKQG